MSNEFSVNPGKNPGTMGSAQRGLGKGGRRRVQGENRAGRGEDAPGIEGARTRKGARAPGGESAISSSHS